MWRFREYLAGKAFKGFAELRPYLESVTRIKQNIMNQFGFGGSNELAAQLGIAVLLFFCMIILGSILLFYIRSENRRWEKRETATVEIYKSIIVQTAESQEKDYHLLKQTLDDNREQIKTMTKLVDRVKIMQEHYDSAFRDLFSTLKDHTANPCYLKDITRQK